MKTWLQFPCSADPVILVKIQYRSSRVAHLVDVCSINMNYDFFFSRTIRSSLANGDESGSSCGYNIWCLTASPRSSLFCCANSLYSFGNGGAFCFSPCYTTSLVSFNSPFYTYLTTVYTGFFRGIFVSKYYVTF